MIAGGDRLLRLLPAIYRTRDAEEGEPLRALLAIVAAELAVLEEDLEQLYDDQFIETCAPWVVPYISDLIGYRGLHGLAPRVRAGRAEVANTIAYRRRKGTATMLEQLARDVTGWPARVVEMFALLGATQHMNHVRPGQAGTPDLRRWEPLERLGTAFETTGHTVDVRAIETGDGRYNIPNVAIALWRLGACSLTTSPAVPVDARRFRVHPLGCDVALVTRPESEEEIARLAGPLNVPGDIGRRVLDAHLADYYGPGLSVEIFADGAPVDRAAVEVCDLSDAGAGWAHQPDVRVAIDPVLGRVAFPLNPPAPADVRATFHYAAAADVGGGEYDRTATLAAAADASVAGGASIQAGLTALGGRGVLEVEDSGRYVGAPALAVAPGSGLELRAANRRRPILVLGGDLLVTAGPDGSAVLSGLLLAGGAVRVPAAVGNELRLLRIQHCTLVPGRALTAAGDPADPDQPSLVVEIPGVTVEIDRSIVGGLRVADGSRAVVTDSIVDATAEDRVALAAPGPAAAPAGPLRVERSTVVGKVWTTAMELVSESILVARRAPADGEAPIRSARKQEGCVRFSYVPLDARVPRRYRCQPDWAVRQAIAAAEKADPAIGPAEKAAIAEAIRRRVRPRFTDRRYGRAAYGQLSARAPVEIRTGAEDESEMGVLQSLGAPLRETDLRTRLDEYLRVGLRAGILHAS